MDIKQDQLLEAEERDALSSEYTKESRKGLFLTRLFLGLLYALWGYLLGGATLPFGVTPLGIALLCSTDRQILTVYAGLCLSAFLGLPHRLLWIGAYTAILLIRLLVRLALDTPWEAEGGGSVGDKTVGEIYPHLFSEHISLRMCTAAVAAFAMGFFRLQSGGFLYYDLYGTILSVIVAPTAVLVFAGFFTAKRENPYRYMSGFLALAFFLILAAKGMTLYGVSLAAFGCMLATLYTTRKHGLLAGIITGTVCGLAISMEAAPLFAFVALTTGLLYPVSSVFAIFSGFSVGAAWGFYTQGLVALNGLFPALLAAATLFAVADKLFFGEVKAQEKEIIKESKIETNEEETVICMPLTEGELDRVRLSAAKEKLQELCNGLSELSRVFYGLSRKMQTPTAADLKQICDNAFDASCVTCRNRSACWGEQYHLTSAEVGNMSAILHRNGHLTENDVGQTLSERCERLPDILQAINHHAALHAKDMLEGDRTEIFALDYGALSELLAAAMKDQEEEYRTDPILEAVLCEALSKLNAGILGVCVWGGRRRRIAVHGSNRELLMQSRDQIRQAVQTNCSFAIGKETVSENDMQILFEEEASLHVSVAMRNLCAEGEETYCGDTAAVFSHANGNFCALISDGMGSGREAAMTSGISGLFLRNLLHAGISQETALHMLNGFLRNRGSGSIHECSATVDLMELDPMSKHASFCKSGAAPTYVFRNGSLFKLRSHTVPVGILKELDTRTIGLDVDGGDVIVMVSDGVTQGREECPWLFDLLRSQGEQAGAERLADLIVKYAKGEGCRDDISVIVIQLQNSKTETEESIAS